MHRDLIEILVAVQEHRAGLDDLELWIVAHLQQDVDEELRTHSDELDALLIQYGESVVSEAELRESLEAMLRNLTTIESVVGQPTTAVPYSTSEAAVGASVTVPLRSLGAFEEYRLPVVVAC